MQTHHTHPSKKSHKEKKPLDYVPIKMVQADPEMSICIKNCLSCFQICEETLVQSLNESAHKDSSYLVLLKSCAEICHTSAKFMMMQSEFHHEVCGVCAKVCLACAEGCEEVGDMSMVDCIKACRKCAESCSKMSKHMAS